MSVARFTIGGIVVLSAFLAAFPLYFRDKKTTTSYSLGAPTHEVGQTPSSKNTISEGDVLGVVNGKEIRLSDLSTQEKQSLYEAQSKLYTSIEGALSQQYIREIIKKYMEEKNIADQSEGERQFIQEKAQLTKERVLSFINENAENPRLKGKTLDEQITIVTPYLNQELAGTYLRSLVDTAEEKGLIKVTAVQEPQAPVVEIDIKNAPSMGDKNAPITIVEFADYQCPFCNRSQPIIKEILKEYQGKVNFVYKNFPLVQIHPQAMPAATAAVCAGQQGKYWEMHDKLFDNYNKLSLELYHSLAGELKLDTEKFSSCLNSEDVKKQLVAEMNYAQDLGITATPAFYINGRQLMGAVPKAEFDKIIQSELKKKGH
jgi:protein-disulfide isomerase